MQSLSTPLLLTVLCSFQSLRVGEGHSPPFQVGLKEVQLETKMGSSDALLRLYLRTHHWDKRESIYYEANSNSFLPSCSPHQPSVAAMAWPSRAVLTRWLWAVAGLRVCPKPAGPGPLPTVVLPPRLCQHTQHCSPAGGTTASETRSPTRWGSPRSGTVLITTVLQLMNPRTPPTVELLSSLCQFLGWQQHDGQTCKPLPKDLPHLFTEAEARSRCFKDCSQS